MKGPSIVASRLDALSKLSARLVDEPAERLFAFSIDLLLDVTPASAALLFRTTTGSAPPALAAERGLVTRDLTTLAQVRRALAGAASQSLRRQATLRIADLEQDLADLPLDDELFKAAYGSLLAVPMAYRQSARGAIVLLFDARSSLDAETREFVENIANLLALAAHHDATLEHEQALREESDDAQRMASLGLLTASVAHELRGPAGALVLQLEEQQRIVQQLDFLSRSGDTAVSELVLELSEITADMDTAIARIRDTVDQLSTLSRRETAFEHIDLSSVVRESLALIRPHLERRGVVLHEQLANCCVTNGRRDSLAQVVLNLIFNAADACDGSAQARPRVSVSVLEEGEHVVLEVNDTGPGVPQDSIPTIFKPFYTTKERGKGTGLGLKICSDVVSAHGGHIEVVNLPSGGASFRVILPRAVGESGVHPVSQSPKLRKAPQPVRRQIFVVDDDPVFTRTVRRALKPHEVRTAATASEAEIALLDPSYHADLVLCDVFLPGTNGHVLHARIRDRRPELARRFVFVTGGALGKSEADYVRSVGCRTLSKPVDLREILMQLDDPDEELLSPNSVKTLAAPVLQRAAGAKSTPPSRR